jgi:hypothetical protein
MGALGTKSEAVKKAIKWISNERTLKPDLSLKKLIESAIFKFDLSPTDSEFLYRLYRDHNMSQEHFD